LQDLNTDLEEIDDVEDVLNIALKYDTPILTMRYIKVSKPL